MKNREKVLSILAFLIVLLFLFGRQYINSETIHIDTEQSTQEPEIEEIYIQQATAIEDGNTLELEVPKIALMGVEGNDDEEKAENFKISFESQGVYMEDIYVNESGKTIMVLNQEQIESYINFENKKLRQAYNNDLPLETNNISISISADFSQINYYVTENCDLFEYSIMVMWVEPTLAVAQTIFGVPSDQWRVKHTVYYEGSGVVMFEYDSGAGLDYEITGEEWTLRMEEVKSQVEGEE